MPKKVIVLGTGLVGNAIAIDLSGDYEVTAVDLNTERFDLMREKGIATRKADLSIPGEIREQVTGFDLAIGALPGYLGYRALNEIIEAGVNLADISFMPEDYFELDEKARQKGVTAVVDCGVAPGMGNLILGYHNEGMKVDSFSCFVGGLPLIREWPFEYKAAFSPIDVIEEYTRPARFVKNGHLHSEEALSGLELMEFTRVGALEAWNSDGLRSLLVTMKIPDMIEKTLRYPGTTEYIKVLRDTGFFAVKEIAIDGKMIRPLDVTSAILFPKWKLGEGEGDLTVMKIIIGGNENGHPVQYSYDLYDEYDPETDTTSMARTTGYTCTAVANLLLEGRYEKKGVSPPEYIGAHQDNFAYVTNYLGKRGVHYKLSKIRK